MIKITICKHADVYKSFKSKGHAGYADEGSDIICAGVSVLIINTINAIETFTEDSFECNQDDGFISCQFTDQVSKESTLLLDAMVLGLSQMQDNYGNEYIKLIFEEV